MKRVSIVTLSVLLPFVVLAPACSSSDDPPDDGGKPATAGTSTSGAGTGNLVPIAGTSNGAAGTSTGGSPGGVAGSSAGGATAGTASGGAATAGAASGGAATAGNGGASTAGTGGGTTNPNCPLKIDSKTACTAVVTCNDAYCGVFKLGSKDCSCAMASGLFECMPCDYTGKTEEIVLPPAAALPACTGDDMTLESTTGCTKGERCRSTDAAKIRFCACWEDPVEGGTVWDCDAMPSSWPK
jgi:hypothetical protein